MRELNETLGFIFEGGFKAGFLEKVLPEKAEGFRKEFFEKLQGLLKDSVIDELKKPPESWGKIGTYIDEEMAEEKYAKLAFILGLEAGRLYGQNHRNARLKKYHLGEASREDVVWENADLIFIDGDALHVVDFKLAGFVFWIKKIFGDSRSSDDKLLPPIPVVNHGVPVNLSVGEVDFLSFAEALVRAKESLEDLQDVFVEVKGVAQLTCYALDYLAREESGGLKKICLELIYPLAESYKVCFTFQPDHITRQRLLALREPVKEIYRSVKKKKSPYQALDSTLEVRPGKREFLLKKFRKDIEYLLGELERREREEKRIRPDPIEEARADVQKSLESFIKDPQPCKALALLHSAGSGKTSAARKLILSLPGNHIILYMATRLRLIEKEVKEVLASGGEDVAVIYDREEKPGSRSLRHTGSGFQSPSGEKGVLWRTVNSTLKNVKEKKYRQVWAFTTIQSVVETELTRTSEYLEALLRPIVLENYCIHIILDEFLGYRNGFYTINEMFDFLRKVKEKGGKANLYLFDANGFSPPLLARLLSEFEKFEVVPDSIVLGSFWESIRTTYKDIPLEIHVRHGYPSGEILLRRKFLMGDFIKLTCEYINETFRDRKSTAFVFIQDKDFIARLYPHLESCGLSTLVATASSKKSQEQINRGKEDVIIGTSSVSRGLDFSRPHKPVNHIYIVVADWGIEQNLVEIIQAISRARGDSRTEMLPKYLHLIYFIPEEQEYVIDNLESLVEFRDRELIRLIYRKEHLRQKLLLDEVISSVVEQFLKKPSGAVLVPIPAQHKTTYRPNRVSDYESIMTFLDDIRLMELRRRSQAAMKIAFLMEILSSAITLCTNEIPGKPSGSCRYYHPYILIEDAVLHVNFDNALRKKAFAIFKELEGVLKEHSEEKTEKISKFLEETASVENYKTSFLLPIYSFVFVRYVLGEGNDRLMKFAIRKKVGRGGATTLGGGLELKTRCLVGDRNEYAVIPLGEDYPYREVLSGRFAKFPVEFVKKLLEGSHA